jgi:hypothetical protein
MTTKPVTPIEIYRILEKSNCGRCQLPSCLAFAAAVVAGRKKLIDCPRLDQAAREQLAGNLKTRAELAPDQAAFIDRLEEKVNRLDLARLAPLVGGVYRDDRLVINSMGKDFLIDQQGQLFSECLIILIKHSFLKPLLILEANAQLVNFN